MKFEDALIAMREGCIVSRKKNGKKISSEIYICDKTNIIMSTNIKNHITWPIDIMHDDWEII